MKSVREITDMNALRLHRRRATREPALFIHEVAADELKERLDEVNKSFTSPLLVGHITDPLERLLPSAKQILDDKLLSAEREAHDLVLHSFALHWADDPVGQLVQARLALKPDGLFLAVMFGGSTLNELRTSLAEAESRLTGSLAPRVLPMAELRDLGGLLGRAGFALPVADCHKISVRYPSLAKLVTDLRGMAETNALVHRRREIPPKSMFALAEQIYREHFSDGDGYLLATFELVFLTGWAPSGNQPRPLRPGSAKRRLSDALGVEELGIPDTDNPRTR
ncbi:MAG: SAM-dependent methyltransferase [Silicimonas sp.]|nr:SAM-dependent methyltransferase [Silicimonas sp.]